MSLPIFDCTGYTNNAFYKSQPTWKSISIAICFQYVHLPITHCVQSEYIQIPLIAHTQCVSKRLSSMIARVCVTEWKINLHFSECALIGRLSVVMTIINVLPIYVHKHVRILAPKYISTLYPCIYPYWCCLLFAYVCACVSWHRNGFMLCFASQKKRKQIAHASLSNFSIFLFLFFSTTGQKGNAYVACCFPSNWIDWMVDRSIVNKQDWSKCRTRRQLNSLDLRTTLWFNGFQKGVSS